MARSGSHGAAEIEQEPVRRRLIGEATRLFAERGFRPPLITDH